MKKQTKWLLAGMMMLAMSANVKAQTFEVDLSKQNPKSYAVEVPDGNYKVTVVLGSKKKAAKTVVRAEARRLMVDEISTKKGKFQTVQVAQDISLLREKVHGAPPQLGPKPAVI